VAAVLITGVNGFIGRTLYRKMEDEKWQIRGVVRRPVQIDYKTNNKANEKGIKANNICLVDDIGPQTDWTKVLIGIDAVVHLAARVHISASHRDSISTFRWVNVQGTRNLAEAAAAANVKRFMKNCPEYPVRKHGELYLLKYC